MLINFFKSSLLTILLVVSATSVRAEILQEILDGCSKDPIVSGSCALISPFYTTTVIVVTPSEWTGTGWGAKKAKIIYRAKNDAATFVATNGQIKGSYLEAAFNLLREEYTPYKGASDLALAEAILAFGPAASKTN